MVGRQRSGHNLCFVIFDKCSKTLRISKYKLPNNYYSASDIIGYDFNNGEMFAGSLSYDRQDQNNTKSGHLYYTKSENQNIQIKKLDIDNDSFAFHVQSNTYATLFEGKDTIISIINLLKKNSTNDRVCCILVYDKSLRIIDQHCLSGRYLSIQKNNSGFFLTSFDGHILELNRRFEPVSFQKINHNRSSGLANPSVVNDNFVLWYTLDSSYIYDILNNDVYKLFNKNIQFNSEVERFLTLSSVNTTEGIDKPILIGNYYTSIPGSGTYTYPFSLPVLLKLDLQQLKVEAKIPFYPENKFNEPFREGQFQFWGNSLNAGKANMIFSNNSWRSGSYKMHIAKTSSGLAENCILRDTVLPLSLIKGGKLTSLTLPLKLNTGNILSFVDWEDSFTITRDTLSPTILCSQEAPVSGIGVALGKDTLTTCMDSLRIETINPSQPSSFFWKTPDGKQPGHSFYMARKTGWYVLYSSYKGCTHADSVFVRFAGIRKNGWIGQHRDTFACRKTGIGVLPALNQQPETRYRWNDGSTDGARLILNTGFYRYWVSNRHGCIDSGSIDVAFADDMPFKLAEDTIVCKGITLNMRVTSSAALSPQSIQWRLNNKILSVSGAAISILFDSSGSQSITATAKNACGEQRTVSRKVMVRWPLQIKFSGDTTVCHGNRVNLMTEGSGGDSLAYSFRWTGTGDTGRTLFAYPKQSGWFTAQLTDNCTRQVARDSIWVEVLNELKIHNLSDTQTCSNTLFRIQPSVSGGYPSGRSVLINGAAWNQLQAGFVRTDTFFTIAVTDPYCANAEKRIRVISIAPAPAILTTNVRSCTPGGVLYSISKPQTGAIYEYRLNAQPSGTGTSGSVLNLPAGKYLLTSRSSFNGCHDTAKLSFTILQSPKATIELNRNFSDILAPHFTAYNKSTYDSICLWATSAPSVRKTIDSLNISYQDTGIFGVSLIAYNKGGCTDTITAFVRVRDIIRLFIPNAFTPDENGLNDDLKIGIRGFSDYSFSMFNRWGQKVLVMKNTNTSEELSKLPQGVYAYHFYGVTQDGEKINFSGTIHILR